MYDESGMYNPDSLENNIAIIQDLSRDIRYTIQQKNDKIAQ